MIYKMSLNIFLLSIFALCSCDEPRPEIKTPYGTYRGHIIKSNSGRELLSFKGIPFAQPPVGKLRFKEPQELEKREGIFDAIEDKECIQPDISAILNPMADKNSSRYTGEEDCLYLNIYVPKTQTKELMPVYFWIHGGGYFAGSGSERHSSPAMMLDGERNMIMVAINYRLGPLGFLSVNDDNLPGNLGMKDQVMALKWVSENIKEFGGDPKSITIAGNSAGASSVSLHLHSKASRGLFQKAISQSGTLDCGWALKPTGDIRQISSKLISALGCSTESDKFIDCLQELPAESVLNSVNILNIPDIPFIIHFTPVLEKESPNAFITEESVKESPDLPWLTGINNQEGLMFYQFYAMAEPKYADMSKVKNEGKRILPIICYYSSHSNPDNVTEQISQFYFKNEFSADSTQHFVELLSDCKFNHGLYSTVRKHKGPLYQYLLSYKGNHTHNPIRPKGLENDVSHGDEIQFFGMNFGKTKSTLNEKDTEMSKTLIDMWYSFMKSGDPTPETHKWEESDGGKKYLHITNDGLSMESDMFKPRMDFLDKLHIHSTAQTI